MRIINLYKRVGESYGDYRYEAFVDYQNDVTKYSTEFEQNGKVNYKMRFQKGIFSLDELQQAYNFNNFASDISKANKRWYAIQRKMDFMFRVEGFRRNIKSFKDSILRELSTQ